MASVPEMPLAEVMQALARTPLAEPQLRAVLATTCARWLVQRGQTDQALDQLGEALELVPELRPAMRLLYRIHIERGDVRTAVTHLDQEIRATRHPREAAALYRERGQLVETHFQDLGAALQCYQAALKATPRDLAVLRSVERVSLTRGDVFTLIENLEAQLEVVQDPAASAGLLRDLALLEARHGGDLALGADLLLAALALFPGHLGLLGDLFRMAEVAGDGELLLHALQMEASARPPDQRAMPLARASAALRELKERDASITLMQAAAHAQPHNYSLWRSLEELSTAAGRHDAALDACIGQLRTIGDEEDPTIRAELYYRLGKNLLFHSSKIPEGLVAMRKALRLDPWHMPAIEDTSRFLIGHAMWAQLLEFLKLQISGAKRAALTPDELALAYLRVGQVLEERLGELEGARQFYEDAIRTQPSFRPARDRRERILHQLGRTEELRAHYREELEFARTTPRRVFLLSLLAQLHAQDDDPAESIKYLVTVLREVPEHLPSLQLLARLFSRAQRPRELLKITEQEVRLTISPVRKAKLLHRAGELALQLGVPDQAIRCFNEALEAVDDHRPSMRSLEELLRSAQKWDGLLEILRKQLLYSNDRSRQIALRLEIAGLLTTRLDRPEDALAELEALLGQAPRHLPALHLAEGLAARLGQHENLLQLIHRHVAAVSGPRTRALLLHRSAVIRSGALGDHDRAIIDLVRALELWPQLGVARARLLRLYEQLGRFNELQAFAEAGLTSERGADDRRAMALQLAELTPRTDVAIQYLTAVAGARPEDYVTQLRLARSCRLARLPAGEAHALLSAIEQLGEGAESTDPHLLALRYRAARAEESAGDMEQADRSYSRILDVDPSHILARRGRVRIKERRHQAELFRRAEELEDAARTAATPAEETAYLTIAAELHERRHDLPRALETIDAALQACPAYLPALHARVHLLEQMGDSEHLDAASQTLTHLADHLVGTRPKADALCRAGTIALQLGSERESHPRAWELFSRALEIDPGCDAAFSGLELTLRQYGAEGAPPLGEVLRRRLDHLLAAAELAPVPLRDLARLGCATEGPACGAELLERGMDVAPDDPCLRGELAQYHALLGQWPDAVRELEHALQREMTPERRFALHYFAGEAHEFAGHPQDAVRHFLAAGRGGFHARHALLRADRIARAAESVSQRVEALQLLVELGRGAERARSLRALADLHRNQLGQPDAAVEIMRELLLLRPTDIEALQELQRLLEKLGRHDEATATLLAGIAHHRAWLRSQGLQPATDQRSGIEPVEGLLRLFEAMPDPDGVYVATSVIEVAAPTRILVGQGCDELVSEPWPLPKPQEGRPLDLLVGDLPASAALDVLREGVFALTRIPGCPPPPVRLEPERALPDNSASVMVVRALSQALGVPQPLVFVDLHNEDTIIAYVGDSPCLILGRRVNTAPFAPRSRDRIGRAILRLNLGGDYLQREASDMQLLGILVGLTRVVGSSKDPFPAFDEASAAGVVENVAGAPATAELHDAVARFVAAIGEFDVAALREALQMAEDRAGAVSAGDPRPAIRHLLDQGVTGDLRTTTLIGYLLSDDHLSLRRALGYHAEIEIKAPAAAGE